MNAALHGTAALSTVVLLAAATLACSSAASPSEGVDPSASGASSGGFTGDAGDSGMGAMASGGQAGAGKGGSSSSGGATSGGTGGSSAAGAGGGMVEPCPDEAGSPMVRVPLEAGGFCIDAHETTRGEYMEFLEEGAAAPQQAHCAWNESFEPTEGQNDDVNLPVVGVDFCDAEAYCYWAGKRLCGKIGGGGTEFDDYASAMESEWQAACSRAGTRLFPYGN